jgi:hypothetical protein
VPERLRGVAAPDEFAAALGTSLRETLAGDELPSRVSDDTSAC